MLYSDTSALVKFYFQEPGGNAVIARASDPANEIFTSVLTLAELHSVVARKNREGRINATELSQFRDLFEKDWTHLLSVVELNAQSMAQLPKLLEEFPLKSGDAVQLSTAIWLSEEIRAATGLRAKRVLEFCVADRKLAVAARACGLQVFNPEDKD